MGSAVDVSLFKQPATDLREKHFASLSAKTAGDNTASAKMEIANGRFPSGERPNRPPIRSAQVPDRPILREQRTGRAEDAQKKTSGGNLLHAVACFSSSSFE